VYERGCFAPCFLAGKMASFAFARKRKETELSKQGGEAIPPGLLRLKKGEVFDSDCGSCCFA